jgi:cell division protein FtsX
MPYLFSNSARLATKIAFTIALAATAFLLSEEANSQTLNSQTLPKAEISVQMNEKLTLQMRKDLLKKLKEESKTAKAEEKQAKEIKKMDKINEQISKLCSKPHMQSSNTCKNQPAI